MDKCISIEDLDIWVCFYLWFEYVSESMVRRFEYTYLAIFECLNVWISHLVHVGVKAAVGGARGEAQRHLFRAKQRGDYTRSDQKRGLHTGARDTSAAWSVYIYIYTSNLTLAPAACGPAWTRIRRKLRRLKSRGARACKIWLHRQHMWDVRNGPDTYLYLYI
jgi:hypothetical protein